MAQDIIQKGTLLVVTSNSWAEKWQPYLRIGRVVRVSKDFVGDLTATSYSNIFIEPIDRNWNDWGSDRPASAKSSNFKIL